MWICQLYTTVPMTHHYLVAFTKLHDYIADASVTALLECISLYMHIYQSKFD